MHHGISSITLSKDQSLANDAAVLNFGRKDLVEEPIIILDRLKNTLATLTKVR